MTLLMAGLQTVCRLPTWQLYKQHGTSGTTPTFPFLLSLLPQSGADIVFMAWYLCFLIFIFSSLLPEDTFIFFQFGQIVKHLLWNLNDPH